MNFKYSLLSTLFVLMLLGHSLPAKAAQILFVAPTRLELTESKKVDVLNVTNLSDSPRYYKISLEDVVMNEKGTTSVVDSYPYSAKKLLRFFPRKFLIQPGERQIIRIMTKFPADTEDGQYHSHIHFLEDKDAQLAAEKAAEAAGEKRAVSGTRVKAPMAYSAMIPIIITKGKIDTQVDWIDPKLSKSDKPNTYKMSTQLTRQGNGQGVAYIDAILVQPDGKQVQIGKRHTAYIYREIDKRDYSFELPFPETVTASGQIKFLLLTGSKNNPALIKEVLLPIP